MSDLTIPAHYPGIPAYTLHFSARSGSVFVSRSWDGGDWVEVHDLNGAAQGAAPSSSRSTATSSMALRSLRW